MGTKKAPRVKRRLGAINVRTAGYGLLTWIRMNRGFPDEAVQGSLY